MVVLKWFVFLISLIAAASGELVFAAVLFALWLIADIYQGSKEDSSPASSSAVQ